MEDSEYNSLKPIMNYPFQNPQSSPSPQPPTQEKQIQNLDKAQTPKNEVSEKDTTKPPKENKITKIQKSLDEFIQGCLNKYKPVENPDPSLYANTTEQEKDLIISKKSTIPDLVIWNKNFNKNDCFADANNEIQSDFPRFRFYLRLGNKDKGGKNKNEKNKNKEKKNKKNKKEKNNNLNNEEDNKEGIDNLTQDMNNLNINIFEKKEMNNMNTNNEKKKKEKKKKNNKNKENKINENQNKFNINPNNIVNNKYDNMNNMNNMNNNNFYPQKIGLDNQHMNNQMNNFNVLNNKFSMSYNNNNMGLGNNNNYNNNNKMMYQQEYQNENELTQLKKLIINYLNNKGWVVISIDQQQKRGPFTSIELFSLLYSQRNNLNYFIIVPLVQNFKITGNVMFITLASIIPNILNRNNKSDLRMTGENQINQNNNMAYNTNNNKQY